MAVERRTIVGSSVEERVAIVSIAVPAGGEVELDPTWRFEGWLTSREWTENGDGSGTVRLRTERPASIDVE